MRSLSRGLRSFDSSGIGAPLREGSRGTGKQPSKRCKPHALVIGHSRIAIESSSRQRNKSVLADTLQNKKRGRCVACVDDEMRPPGLKGVGLAASESNVLFGFPHEHPYRTFEHVERILHVRVVMPWHFLRRRNLQLV